MNRHPQNDIPFEVRMKYIIQAYRKDKEKLESLQRYAEGLEEENVSLQKQLDEQIAAKENVRKKKNTIHTLKCILKSQETYISNLQLLLVENNIPFHYKQPINDLEAAGIVIDSDSIPSPL